VRPIFNRRRVPFPAFDALVGWLPVRRPRAAAIEAFCFDIYAFGWRVKACKQPATYNLLRSPRSGT
jgi:hypothetical protein